MSEAKPLWPRAVVFDLDGTLIDSAPDIAEALNRALAGRNLAPFPLDGVRAMIGGGITKLVERALVARGMDLAELPLIAESFVASYRRNLTVRTTLFEGARDLLGRLQGEGRRLGLLSNKRHELTVEILSQLDIARYFDAVIGEGAGYAQKPDPAPLLAILSRLRTEPGDSMMVGDSGADIVCAKSAGVVSIAVSFGYSRTPASELGADAAVDRLESIPDCFARLERERQG